MLSVRRALPQSRNLFSSGARAPKTLPLRSSWRRTARGYASDSHGSHSSGSDIPWALGAIGVTTPAAYYLWTNGISRDEGHGHEEHGEHEEHDEHADDDGEGEQEAEKEEKGAEQVKEEPQEGGDDGKQAGSEEKQEEQSKAKPVEESSENPQNKETSDESSSEDDGRKDTPDTSDDEGESKEAENEGEGKKEGDSEEKPRWGKKNKGPLDAGQKVPTHAKHKGKPHEDGALSKKGEGIHDTAKVLEPIDPFRSAKPKRSDE